MAVMLLFISLGVVRASVATSTGARAALRPEPSAPLPALVERLHYVSSPLDTNPERPGGGMWVTPGETVRLTATCSRPIAVEGGVSTDHLGIAIQGRFLVESDIEYTSYDVRLDESDMTIDGATFSFEWSVPNADVWAHFTVQFLCQDMDEYLTDTRDPFFLYAGWDRDFPPDVVSRWYPVAWDTPIPETA